MDPSGGSATTKLNGKSASLSQAATQQNGHDDIMGHGLSPNPYKWTEEEVVQWIKHIGYSQYAELFTQEHVNGEALLALTKDEFGQLGIYALGHTKNILSKIQLLAKAATKFKPRDPYTDNDFKSPYTFDQRDYWASHPEAYSQDKQRDKNTYWELWTKIVQHRDFMMEHDYKKLMSRSGLAKHDIDMIWKLATSQNHGRCSFDEFTSIMKLSHLAQTRIPLYIINVSKLIFYHPPLASTEFFEFSAIFSDLQKQQVLQNMVGFYNLPSPILDSDDRLMELEKKALRPYHPIHFEINAKVLIATFSDTISEEQIQELEKGVLKTLKDQMGFGKNMQMLDKVYVQRPSPKELGMTPAGPPPDAANPAMNTLQPNAANLQHNHMNAHHGNKALAAYKTENLGMYHPMNNNNGNHVQAAPHAHSAMNVYEYQHQPAPPHHGAVPPMYADTMESGTPAMSDKINVHEMQAILLCDDFWEEFRVRSEIDKLILSSDEKIRTRQAMQMVAKLRNVALKAVKFTDEGVKIIANKTKFELKEQFVNEASLDLLHLKATLLGLSEMDIPQQVYAKNVVVNNGHNGKQQRNNDMSPSEEMYKGIVIEGLPDAITNDDENIRRLDSAVLNEFIVSHIEVVDNVLRITFANEVTHKNINQLRKYLKSFLKDDIKLDKKSMKNVSIIPHTRDTWKGETTERSVEVHNNNQYINVGMDSITATPNQQGINPVPMHQHHNNYNYQGQPHYYNHQ
eukprot:CAMPEP_0197030160 /NCGR_PEP_ID=MMETSP1384-20130603/9449_1 /TAXON_ID=29189 /ORGANISM="Ammonia sp." /LENGTH=738 /DNA_ID=CAMNT_0042459451 /DNA_START=191 /DNA_END=2407 /DNA_ORIENTATION=+